MEDTNDVLLEASADVPLNGCTASSPKILVEDVSTETWTAVKAVVGDLLLALRGDEVLFVREVDGPADVTVVAS